MDTSTENREITRLLAFYDDEIQRLRKWLIRCIVFTMFAFIATGAWIAVLIR